MAKDFFHETVKTALQKDGWDITHDPFNIKYGDVELKVDLAAEKIIAAEKGNLKIAIEIKSFIGPSIISEFNSALGQYLSYLKIINKIEPDRTLYLAIPLEIENFIYRKDFFKEIISEYNLKFIVYDPTNEEITSWID